MLNLPGADIAGCFPSFLFQHSCKNTLGFIELKKKSSVSCGAVSLVPLPYKAAWTKFVPLLGKSRMMQSMLVQIF